MPEYEGHGKKSVITRRAFVFKSAIAVAALGTAGISGYSVLNDEKTILFLNYHRMGHCAPSVMETLLQINHIKNPGLVKTAGAMAGGIAGPRMECGALTAPVMYLGYQKKMPESDNDKLLMIRQTQSYFNAFLHDNGTTICTNIRDKKENGCWKAISGFYSAFEDSINNPLSLSSETEESYLLLLNAFKDQRFHCSHNVLNELKTQTGQQKELYAASWPFIGGIAMLNRTCGALAAGVMALSYSVANIETSFFRVASMNKMLRENDEDALSNDVNQFNNAINKARKLGTWFSREYGSSTCLDICGYNFSQRKDANNYLSGNCMQRCSLITEKVAAKVKSMIL
jgi:C_GCAxxG_C_C family probable redox protein